MNSLRFVDIFRLTSRPNITYFYKNKDPNDLRLGSLVKSNPLNYEESKFVLVGCPQDLGVKRNEGIPGSNEAPDAIRKALYQLAYPKELENFGFFDLGNIILEKSLEESHNKLYEVVRQLLLDGKTAIVLGGGSDITYPNLKATANTLEDILAINVSNKYKVADTEQCHNESSFRMIIDEEILGPEFIHHLGIQPAANSYLYHQYLKERGSTITYQRDIKYTGLRDVLKGINTSSKNRQLFWSFDINVINSADAPGVRSITPTGISGDEAIEIARYAGGMENSRIIELTEVNPTIDVDDRTSRLAAMMIIHFVSKRVL